MRITLRSLWRSFAVIGVALATFGVAPGAMAGIIGSGTLKITNGIFDYDSSGTASFTGVYGDHHPYTELVTGDFIYKNTLPSNSANFHYQASANVDVNGGATGGGQSFSRSIDLGYTTFNAIIFHQPAKAAYEFFGVLEGNSTGSGTFTAPGGGGPYAFNWAYATTGTPTLASASGSFDLWSDYDYSGSGNPGNLTFPNSATFTANMRLDAVSVPEPGTLGLLSLGLLIIGWLGRRKSA